MNGSLQPHTKTRLKVAARIMLAVGMMLIGVMHFVDPAPFVKIVPSFLPAPRALVYLSGAFEILGGIGILPEKTRRLSGYGLIALYLAVFPANVNMAIRGIQITTEPLAQWVPWARLPFQLLLIAWAWWVTRTDDPNDQPSRSLAED